jgi:ankyrin repeat protein
MEGIHFADWPSLAAYVDAVLREGPVFEFESAVEAVINGDLAALEDGLRRDPALVHARSSRFCCFDPPVVHRATLLHYVAANGVEQYRQKTPPNAVEIARALLQAGAEPDALADMYGVECTTMSMLVSSDHPAKAGLQVALVDLLLDFGAAIEGCGTKKWGGPLFTALAFGMSDAAQALAKRGARIDLPTAAGLGLMDDAARLLPSADAEARHRALALAAQHRRAEIVRLLLDAGEDPNRYNPEGTHGHSTPLHQAVLAGDGTAPGRTRRAARYPGYRLAGHPSRLGPLWWWKGAG